MMVRIASGCFKNSRAKNLFHGKAFRNFSQVIDIAKWSFLLCKKFSSRFKASQIFVKFFLWSLWHESCHVGIPSVWNY